MQAKGCQMETINKKGKISFATKKCPICSADLQIETTTCSWCNNKVGKIDKHGIAKKPFNWLSYLICLLAWAAFFIYVWLVF